MLLFVALLYDCTVPNLHANLGAIWLRLSVWCKKEHVEVGQLASLKADQTISAKNIRTTVTEVVPINLGFASVLPLAA